MTKIYFNWIKSILFVLLVVSIFTISCTSTNSENTNSASNIIENDYAKGFSIEKNKNYNKISVFNPWQNADGEKYEYYLVPKDKEIPKSLGVENVIRTPISKAVYLSTTYLGYIKVLDERNSIIGISGTNYVYDSIIQAYIDNGLISEVGFEQNLDIEKIISLKPDIVFAYDITGSLNSKYEQLKKLGIQVVLVGEYLENEPLGKAEWLKFFATFFEKELVANEYFYFVKNEYLEKKQQVVGVSSYPGVLVNIPFQGIWYMPGGDSYMAKIIDDAGGNYLWKNHKQVESFPVSLEEIFGKKDSISVLINPGFSESIDDIIKTESRLSELNCIKNQLVFNNNKRIGKNGGNDIWESGTVNPHLILQDLINILHPELANENELYYYTKLK